MPVHFGGVPVSLKRLADFKREHRCVSLKMRRMPLVPWMVKIVWARWGIFRCLVFILKNLSAAEVGLLVTNDEALFDRIQKLHFHGLDRSAWDRFQKKGRAGCNIVAPALKFNMTDIQAAGLCQFERFETLQEKRQYLADRYLKGLAMCPY